MRGEYKLPDGMIMMDDGSTLSVEAYLAGGYRPKAEKLKNQGTASKKKAARAADANAGEVPASEEN